MSYHKVTQVNGEYSFNIINIYILCVEMYNYDERLSKNYKVNLRNGFQAKYFRPAVTSRDSDVFKTWITLNKHMPPISKSGHLFLPLADHIFGTKGILMLEKAQSGYG